LEPTLGSLAATQVRQRPSATVDQGGFVTRRSVSLEYAATRDAQVGVPHRHPENPDRQA